jgi:type II secretory pathway component PulJ
MLIASGLLALVIGAAFAVLLSSVADLRASEQRARQSEEMLMVHSPPGQGTRLWIDLPIHRSGRPSS